MDIARVASLALYGNLAWYAVLCIMFGLAGNLGKTLYFLGAAILTIGVIIL